MTYLVDISLVPARIEPLVQGGGGRVSKGQCLGHQLRVYRGTSLAPSSAQLTPNTPDLTPITATVLLCVGGGKKKVITRNYTAVTVSQSVSHHQFYISQLVSQLVSQSSVTINYMLTSKSVNYSVFSTVKEVLGHDDLQG